MDSARHLTHVPQLDGLRGVLALWVVVSHILCWCGWIGLKLSWPLDRLWSEFIYSQPAVETFIILSGFAISFLLDTRHSSYPKFVLGRAFRLYPVYLVCVGAAVAATFLVPAILERASWRYAGYLHMVRNISEQEHSNLPTHALAHLTLLHGVLPKQVLPQSSVAILPRAWSLSLEWQYYLVAPLIAWLVRYGSGWVVLAVGAWAGAKFGADWQNSVSAFLPAFLPLFLVGIGSYHAYAWACRRGDAGRDFAVPSAAVVALAIVTGWHTWAVAIWAVALGSASAGGSDPYARMLRAAKWLLTRGPVQYLGAISYPLYLIHWPLIVSLLWVQLRCWPDVTADQATAVLFGLGLPTILLAAALIHHFVEKPTMAMGKRLTR